MFLFQVWLFVPPSEDTEFAWHTDSAFWLGEFAVFLKSQSLHSASIIGRSVEIHFYWFSRKTTRYLTDLMPRSSALLPAGCLLKEMFCSPYDFSEHLCGCCGNPISGQAACWQPCSRERSLSHAFDPTGSFHEPHASCQRYPCLSFRESHRTSSFSSPGNKNCCRSPDSLLSGDMAFVSGRHDSSLWTVRSH